MNKKVLLTIDTEGPRGTDPVLYQIWGRVGDKYYGVPKIIEICDKYQVKGLFFVDIPEMWDLGAEKIREVVDFIRAKGHSVGMHIHPHHMPAESRHFLYEYTKEEQREIIRLCTERFIEVTGELPVSFRAGKYGANRDTLDLLSEMGYKYDFSEFYGQKWCAIKPEIAYALPVKYDKLIEFPVTVFKSIDFGGLYKRYDKLEVCECYGEIVHILDRYLRTGNEEVLILFLHSFSFVNFLDAPDAPTINHKGIKCFENVLKYIYEHPNLEFIRESDLDGVSVADNDNVNNIVKTKGFFRQLWYFYVRAFRIRKNNKKARLLTVAMPLAIILIACILLCAALLIAGIWR